MSLVDLTLALVITAIAAMLQGSVGLGFAMVSVPLLSLIDPRLAPVPQLLVSLPLALAMAWRGLPLANMPRFKCESII